MILTSSLDAYYRPTEQDALLALQDVCGARRRTAQNRPVAASDMPPDLLSNFSLGGLL